jgi:hypothetical protein
MNMIKTFAIFCLMIINPDAFASHRELLSQIKTSDYESFKSTFAQAYNLDMNNITSKEPIYIDANTMHQIAFFQQKAAAIKALIQFQQLEDYPRIRRACEKAISDTNLSIGRVAFGVLLLASGVVLPLLADTDVVDIALQQIGGVFAVAGCLRFVYTRYNENQVSKLVERYLAKETCSINAANIDELLKRCVAKQSDN